MAVYTKSFVLRWKKRVKNSVKKLLFRSMLRNENVEAKVVFMSFGGRQYSDNPKAISDELHRIRPDIKQVWIINDDEVSAQLLPEWIEFVGSGDERDRQFASAAVWVSNFELPNYYSKLTTQLYIQTYHGDRAMKKVLYEATPVRDLHLMEERYCDYLVTGSAYAEEWMPKAFKSNAELLKAGCPRNDKLLFCSEEEFSDIRSRVGIPLKSKVLLYAPTFRDDLDGLQSTYGLDLGNLLDVLEEKDECSWSCLVRKHPTSKGIDYDTSDKRIIDASDYPFSEEVLAVSDMLITDYSSIGNDFILSRKPVLLYLADYEEYKRTRGVFFSLEEAPYFYAESHEELISLVLALNERSGHEEYKKIADYYGIYEDGKASEKIAALIAGHVDSLLTAN